MELAAGYILFCSIGGERRFLLLRNARHGTWAFPKGHLEPGEDDRAGARREVLEETGISRFREVAGFEHVLRYRLPPRKGEGERRWKQVRFFLAEVPAPEWTRSDEHDEGGWFPAGDVEARLQHQDLKEAFQAALRHLKGQGQAG